MILVFVVCRCQYGGSGKTKRRVLNISSTMVTRHSTES